MKKNKLIKIILMVCILLILVFIVLFVSNVSKKDNVEYDVRRNVYGVWEIETYEVYTNGVLEDTINKYNQLTIHFTENNVEFCYNINSKWDCSSHNYWIENGVLTIYTFESGKLETNFNYTLNEKIFVLRDGDETNYTLSTFTKVS